MTYQTGNMLLQKTKDVLSGKINDVIVCRDVAADTPTFYTLLVIRDHLSAKRFLECFNSADRKDIIVASFANKGEYIVVLDYYEERPVSRFFSADIEKVEQCEQLCMRVVAECMSCGIPYPVMLLALKQDQLNEDRDGNAFFTFNLDLSELDNSVTERECAQECANIFFKLFRDMGIRSTASYKLLEMKNRRQEYKHFTELYKDLKASALDIFEGNKKEKLQNAVNKRKDGFLRFLAIVCLIIAFFALIMFLSNLIFGDYPAFLRIFVNPFKQIGTESMLQ